MVLIADSGSTKTHWSFLDSDKDDIITEGINPYYLSSNAISELILNSSLSSIENIDEVLFFGAGCNSIEKETIVKEAILAVWSKAQVTVKSDLLASCYATSKKEHGICCILGTGANSCLYNGTNIIENTPPLGFILGDEGSGAYLGKALINLIYKNKLGYELQQAFEKELECNMTCVLDKVYKQAWPNRFLASLAPFIKQNISHPLINTLVYDAFKLFIQNNVMQYTKAPDVPIHFVGSIAYYFQDILRNVVKDYGLQMGEVMQSPMEGLKVYYKKTPQ